MRHSTSAPLDALRGYSLFDTLVVAAGLVVAGMLALVALSYGVTVAAVAGGVVTVGVVGRDTGGVVRAGRATVRLARDGARRVSETAPTEVASR